MTFYEAQKLLVPEGATKFYPILPRGVGARGIPLFIESPIAPDIPVRLVYEADTIQTTPPKRLALSDTPKLSAP